MADKQSTVSIVFQGDDRVSQTIRQINTSLDGFGSVVTNVAQPLANVAEGVLAVNAALAALVAAGLTYAFNKSKDFESATIELKKVLGDQPEVIKAVQEKAMELSNTYGESSADLLMMTADYKQAGFDINEALGLTKSGLDLMIAGNLEASQSSDILIRTLNGFKEPAAEANRLIDILNETSNNYATDIAMLSEGMADISPVAKTMGFSMEETAGLLTPIIEVFGSGSEAARALRTGLNAMVSDAKPVQEALASLGVSQKDANGQFREGKEIFYDVAKAFTGLAENEKLYYAQQLVGTEQSARMLEVLNNLPMVLEVTEGAFNSAGSAAREVAERLKSAEVAVNRFEVGFENLGITIGNQFIMAAKGAYDGAAEIELALQKAVNDGSFEPIFAAIRNFGAKAETLFRDIAKNLPAALEGVDFEGLLGALGELGRAIGSYFGDIDLSTVEGLQDFIQGIVDSLEGLTNITIGMAEQFKPFIDFIKEAVLNVQNMDAETQKGFGNVLAAAELVVQAGWKVAAALAVIKESGVQVESVWNLFAGAIKFAWNALQTAFDQVASSIVGVIYGINDALASITWGERSKYFQERADYFKEWLDAINTDKAVQTGEMLEGIQQSMAGITGETHKATDWTKEFGLAVDTAGASVEKLPAKKSVEIVSALTVSADGKDAEEIAKYLAGASDTKLDQEKQFDIIAALGGADKFKEEVSSLVDGINPEKKVDILFDAKSTIDGAPAKFEEIAVWRSGNAQQGVSEGSYAFKVPITPEMDQSAVEKTEKTLDNLTSEKELSIKLQGEIDEKLKTIETEAAKIQTAIEWQAKLDIAQVEANAKKVEAVMQAVSSEFESTGSTITSLFSDLNNMDYGLTRSLIEKQIREESEMRTENHEKTMEMLDQQIRREKLLNDKMEKGEAIATVEAAGLEPHLEAIWFEVMKAIQIRGTEDGLEFLT